MKIKASHHTADIHFTRKPRGCLCSETGFKVMLLKTHRLFTVKKGNSSRPLNAK